MDIEAAEIDTDTGAEDDMDTDAEDDIDTDAEDDIDTDPDRPDGRPGETTFGRDSPRDGAVEAGATLDDGSEGDAQEDDEDDGSEGIDVVATYATVRGALEREFDIDSRWTSREFYHACKIRGLDEERLTALERLTQAYETVQYGDDPTLDVAELRAAAARFQADTGTSPDAPADEA
jgi:hypothetical protein